MPTTSEEKEILPLEESSQKLLAKAHTEMTFQNIKSFNYKIRKKQRIATLSSCLAFAVFGFYTLALPVKSSGNIIFFFALSLFFLFIHLAYCGVFDSEKQFRQKTYFSGTGQDFYFYETAFVVLLSNGSAPQTQVNYSQLEKVEENADYFYLYLQKNSAYLVAKNGFEEGSPAQLTAILQKKLSPAKYSTSL